MQSNANKKKINGWFREKKIYFFFNENQENMREVRIKKKKKIREIFLI
jgi:hypothetical protein